MDLGACPRAAGVVEMVLTSVSPIEDKSLLESRYAGLLFSWSYSKIPNIATLGWREDKRKTKLASG